MQGRLSGTAPAASLPVGCKVLYIGTYRKIGHGSVGKVVALEAAEPGAVSDGKVSVEFQHGGWKIDPSKLQRSWAPMVRVHGSVLQSERMGMFVLQEGVADEVGGEAAGRPCYKSCTWERELQHDVHNGRSFHKERHNYLSYDTHNCRWTIGPSAVNHGNVSHGGFRSSDARAWAYTQPTAAMDPTEIGQTAEWTVWDAERSRWSAADEVDEDGIESGSGGGGERLEVSEVHTLVMADSLDGSEDDSCMSLSVGVHAELVGVLFVPAVLLVVCCLGYHARGTDTGGLLFATIVFLAAALSVHSFLLLRRPPPNEETQDQADAVEAQVEQIEPVAAPSAGSCCKLLCMAHLLVDIVFTSWVFAAHQKQLEEGNAAIYMGLAIAIFVISMSMALQFVAAVAHRKAQADAQVEAKIAGRRGRESGSREQTWESTQSAASSRKRSIFHGLPDGYEEYSREDEEVGRVMGEEATESRRDVAVVEDDATAASIGHFDSVDEVGGEVDVEVGVEVDVEASTPRGLVVGEAVHNPLMQSAAVDRVVPGLDGGHRRAHTGPCNVEVQIAAASSFGAMQGKKPGKKKGIFRVHGGAALRQEVPAPKPHPIAQDMEGTAEGTMRPSIALDGVYASTPVNGHAECAERAGMPGRRSIRIDMMTSAMKTISSFRQVLSSPKPNQGPKDGEEEGGEAGGGREAAEERVKNHQALQMLEKARVHPEGGRQVLFIIEKSSNTNTLMIRGDPNTGCTALWIMFEKNGAPTERLTYAEKKTAYGYKAKLLEGMTDQWCLELSALTDRKLFISYERGAVLEGRSVDSSSGNMAPEWIVRTRINGVEGVRLLAVHVEMKKSFIPGVEYIEIIGEAGAYERKLP
jgi:hypothetical protein